MYKLVAVGGKLRGKEFVLEDGENVAGREESCDIPLPVNGVSKKHFSLTVTDDVCYLQDLGSSNGTFLNGKVVKRATVKGGDKIALPDLILQLVYVKEKKVVIKKKKVEEEEDDQEWLTGGKPPASLPAKMLWLFRYKLMPVVHGINQEYEWKSLFGILLSVFCVVVITLTIFPVLQDSKKILLSEVALRGAHYADEIARMNRKALEQKQLDALDTGFLDKEDGVKSYRLFDLNGRIVRPMEKLNTYIEDTFSVEALSWANSGKAKGELKKLLDDGEVGIAKTIMAFNPRTGVEDPVGIIAIRFTPKSLQVEAVKSSKAYLEALVTSAIVAIVFFGIIYYMTLRPIEEMKYQIEDSLRGKRKSLESTYLFDAIDGLRSSINTILQRIRELQNQEEEGEFEEESDSSYVQTMGEFMRGTAGAAIVLDSQKNIAKMNMMAEDLTGIRENASVGMSLLDVAREQGFAATVIELCDNSANNNGTHQQGEYELGGNPHSVNVVCLLGKDGFAKSFLITLNKVE